MKKIFQFITAIGVVAAVAISATSEPSSEAALLTAATISQTIKAMPAKAAVDRPLWYYRWGHSQRRRFHR